jgi:hypothetical protein
MCPEVAFSASQLRRQAWADAVRLQLRWAAACDGVGAASSQAKAYLAAVVIWLFAQNAREAWACYQVRVRSVDPCLSSARYALVFAPHFASHPEMKRRFRRLEDRQPLMHWHLPPLVKARHSFQVLTPPVLQLDDLASKRC